MNRRKLFGTLIGVFAFLALIIGVTYAYFSWTSGNTNVNLTVAKDLKNHIVYKQGTAVLGTSDETLNPSDTYTGGISTTIEFWKKPNSNKTIYGQISMEILNLLSITDTSDTNITKTETIKWVITTYNVNNSEEQLLAQGNFLNKAKGNKFALSENFELNNFQTFYKVYLWYDSNAVDVDKSVGGELISTEISASASDTMGTYSYPANEYLMKYYVGDSWESGASGLYATNAYTAEDGTTKYHEYRYIGAEVDNYVWFNNDMYRIIGIFDENSHGREGEQLIKLISANVLTANSWGVHNSSMSSGSSSSFSSNWDGKNSTSPANANVLLNQFFYNKSSYLDGFGYCTGWTYFNEGNNYKTNDCSDIIGHGVNVRSRGFIQEVTWYLKGYKDANYNKNDFYICERSNDIEITDCNSGNNGGYSKSASGYIGLMYVSDYLYASGKYESTNTINAAGGYHGNNNWLYKGYEWTITPDSDSDGSSIYVHYIGNLGSYSNITAMGVRPTFYLKSGVLINGGKGTIENPFTLSM